LVLTMKLQGFVPQEAKLKDIADKVGLQHTSIPSSARSPLEVRESSPSA
jgi:hypothetical protein